MATKKARKGSSKLKHFPLIINHEHEAKLAPADHQNDEEDVDSPFPRNKNHLIWIINGKRRSGKSTVLRNALLNYYNGHFTNVYFFSPSARRDTKLKPIVDTCCKNFTFYEEFTGNAIQEVINDIEADIKMWEDLKMQYEIMKKDPLVAKKDLPPEPVEPRNLLILDDCVDKFGNHMDKTHPLVAICNNCYHKKLSVWVATQKFKYLLPAMRVNMDMITIFKCCNDQEKKAIEEEVSVPIKILKACYNDAMCEPFGSLHIHWIDRGIPKLFSRGSQFDIPESRLLVYDDDDADSEEFEEFEEDLRRARTLHKEKKATGKKIGLKLLDEVDLAEEEGLRDPDKALLAKVFPTT